MRYADRVDAGNQLATAVVEYLADDPEFGYEAVVVGVPRGGVVVAAGVAHALAAPLDVALARKIGAPHNPELAIGAIGEEGEPFLATDLIDQLGVTGGYLDSAIAAARTELSRRARLYRQDRPRLALGGRDVVIVDDGVATGATLLATIRTIRSQQARLVMCAVPVGARDSLAIIGREVDVVVCPLQPRWFRAVGEWYDVFTQTTDAEVVEMLAREVA